MNSKPSSRYSIAPSTPYLLTFLVISLLINVAIWLGIYFGLNPLIMASSFPERNSKIMWGVFVGVMFIIFALTFAIINSHRYWIDTDYLQVINVYRPKKRKTVMYSEVKNIFIKKIPFLSERFDFGTVVFVTYTETGRKKVLARFLGIKFPDEIYLELSKYTSIEDKEESIKDLLL
ncbi:MAG: hypothetical protein ACTSXA_13725 [Candidatus Heimdallarchaeota archaeon]